MATYLELQKQIEALQREADVLKTQEREGVIERMKEAIDVYNITAAELGLRREGGARGAGRKMPAAKQRRSFTLQGTGPAYLDGKGNSWGGRGPRPKWLREALASGAKLEDFAGQQR